MSGAGPRARWVLGALLAALPPGARADRIPVGGDPAVCRCEAARRENGWCAACKVGYVAAVRVPSAVLFETLDAHGHGIEPERIACPTCKDALRTDGFCDVCRMGFIEKRAYLSRLSYHVARGRVIDPAKLECETCRKNAAGHGWCDACQLGLVGNFAVKERGDLEPARRAFELLHKAIATIPRCETCAVALFTGGGCRHCKLRYRDGKPVP